MRRVVRPITATLFVTMAAILPAVARGQAASSVVLGSALFAGPPGEGWGTSKPSRLYNGGDPSGLLTEIRWVSWGGSSAIGFGLDAIFKPQGGYYSRPVIVELRASALGKCNASGASAYSRLFIRGPERPEGPLRPWSSWSGSKSLCKFGF
jgi:hypothetical protein